MPISPKNRLGKWLIVLPVCLLTLAVTAACGSSGSTKGGGAGGKGSVTTLRLASTANPGDDGYLSGQHFAKLVSEKTNGRLKIQLFPAGQLGTETELLPKLKSGSIDIYLGSSSVASTAVPELKLFDLPYVLKNYDQANQAFGGGKITDLANDAISKDGYVNLGFIYFGFRDTICNGLKIQPPNFFKGVKIRVPQSPIPLELFKRLGASPQPIAYTEVFTALQTKLVTCVEDPDELILTSNLYQVAKDVSITRHEFSTGVIMFDKKRFDGLSSDFQKALREAGAETSKYARALTQANNEKALQTLENDHGVTITQTPTATLAAAAKPMYTEFAKTFKDKALYDAYMAFTK
jgi:tripartite ATP-independent transporter DctP family solute receptor